MFSAHVFTIPPGVPFLECFVAELLDGHVVKGFSRALGPIEIANATIYVPTRRAARALASEFARALNRPATLLPRILPLGALDATETSLLFEEPGFDLPLSETLPEAASEIWRRMHCARLTLTWANALRHAIVAIGRDGRPVTDASEALLVGTSSLDSWHLAGELVNLIDEMIIEGIGWERLDPLVLPEFDTYWRITLDFLNIAMEQWPRILHEHQRVDPATRRMRLIEAQMRALENRANDGPVIAVGSTGSNSATARLLAAIARAPQGAVVLPGLDQSLDEAAWQRIAAGRHSEHEAAFSHPQATLHRLLPALGVRRADVIELGSPAPPLAARMRLLSEALRPADTTELWRDYRARTSAAEIELALADVTLIEAADEREEALCLAIALRQVLETPSATAALVTPDRDLARRVAVELTRWDIEVDDSAGEPLSASSFGVLAALVAACAEHKRAAADIIALLDHPLARLGHSRTEIARLAPLLEIGILRCGFELADFGSVPAIIAAAQTAGQTITHPAARRIKPGDWDALADLLERLTAALAPLEALQEQHDLKQWTAAHRQALDAVVRSDETVVLGDDYDAFGLLFDELFAAALPELTFDSEAYRLFIMRMARETPLRRAQRTHPRLKIFGLLEARLMHADVMLLGGLDETIWPPQVRSDAFLNRPMRAALGLTPPERRIGQTAHDFTAAMGNPRVILSRALKRNGAPTVASRFVQRLAAVAGAHFDAPRQRGAAYVELARLIDRPERSAPASRPMPRPDLALRPNRLSVTRIEMLRRDPYAIYAEFILRLVPLPPLGRQSGAHLIGSAIHAVLEDFVRRFPAGPLPTDARDILTVALAERLAAYLGDADFVAFQWPLINRAIDFYLEFENVRRDRIRKIDVEAQDAIEIPLDDGSIFSLSAKADRIEHLTDGSVVLVDYKTGTPPGLREVHVGFAPQLTLEAAMATRGAFGLKAGVHPAGALYLKLGGRTGGRVTELIFEKQQQTFADVAERHFEGLIALLNQFRRIETAYLPRPFPKFAARYNDYDHLARVKEWSTGADEGGSG